MQIGTVNVRVTRRTHQQLVNLATANGVSMQSVLDSAVEVYRRQCFLEALNADFVALRERPEDLANEIEERHLWEQTLSNGLEET